MYTFKKDRDLTNQFDFSEITTKVDAISADDICVAFYFFMLGNGFEKQTILDSFQYVTDNYAEVEKDLDK